MEKNRIRTDVTWLCKVTVLNFDAYTWKQPSEAKTQRFTLDRWKYRSTSLYVSGVSINQKQQRLVKSSVYLQVRYKALKEGIKRVPFSEEGDLRQRQTSTKAIKFNLL